MYLVSVI